MGNKYEISNDGSIFTIDNDGTIRRIGKIDNQGNIEGRTKNRSSGLLWIFLVIAVAVSVILGLNLSTTNADLSRMRYNYNNEISEFKQQNENLKNKNSKLENKINSFSSSFPFKIEKIELGNVDNSGTIDNYGSTLYGYRMRYLTPKIYYTGFVSGKSITVHYKIFNPSGTLNYNSSYSTIYTGGGTSVTILEGSNNTTLKGWGNANASTYSSGTYRIEIWYNGMCFGSRSFYIS
jgi:cell division protein FtsB